VHRVLPRGADDQRVQMVRRLAAEDDSMDILGLDVTWTQEFASAEWILEWAGEHKAEAERDTLAGPLLSAQFEGKLFAAPKNTNVQLLSYRTDLVDAPGHHDGAGGVHGDLDGHRTEEQAGEPAMAAVAEDHHRGVAGLFDQNLRGAADSTMDSGPSTNAVAARRGSTRTNRPAMRSAAASTTPAVGRGLVACGHRTTFGLYQPLMIMRWPSSGYLISTYSP
jgi:hypothetical protein